VHCSQSSKIFSLQYRKKCHSAGERIYVKMEYIFFFLRKKLFKEPTLKMSVQSEQLLASVLYIYNHMFSGQRRGGGDGQLPAHSLLLPQPRVLPSTWQPGAQGSSSSSSSITASGTFRIKGTVS
jgi:hypothetical protein